MTKRLTNKTEQVGEGAPYCLAAVHETRGSGTTCSQHPQGAAKPSHGADSLHQPPIGTLCQGMVPPLTTRSPGRGHSAPEDLHLS